MATSIYDTVVDDDAPGPPISVPDSGDTGEGGRLKMIIQLVKRSLGVKDLAAMFVSFSHKQGYPYLKNLFDHLGVSHYPLRCWNLSLISNTGITLIDQTSLQRTPFERNRFFNLNHH